MSDKDQRVFVDCSFAFAVVWSIGGTTDGPGRKKFDDFFRKLVDKRVDEKPERADYDLGPGVAIAYPDNKLAKTLPAASEGSVYDLHFDKEMGRWKNWLKVATVDTSPVHERTAFLDIVVTTIDTVRYRFLFDLLVDHGKHVLFAGPTGRGRRCTSSRAGRARQGQVPEHPEHLLRADQRQRRAGHHRLQAGQAAQGRLRPAHRKPRRGVCGRPQHARARGVRRAAAHRARAPVLRPRRLVRPRRALHAAAGGRAVRRSDGPARGPQPSRRACCVTSTSSPCATSTTPR